VADWYGPEPSREHSYDNIGFLAMKRMAEKISEGLSCKAPPTAPFALRLELALVETVEVVTVRSTAPNTAPAVIPLARRQTPSPVVLIFHQTGFDRKISPVIVIGSCTRPQKKGVF
jgi:hypothetical protein